MNTKRMCWMVMLVLLLLGGCSDDGDKTAPDGDTATDGDAATDGDLDPDAEAEPDQTPDGDGEGDASADGDLDAEPEREEAASGLPQALPFSYTRTDTGEPVSQAEIQAFTRKLMGFLKKIDYFNYVLDTTHGVDASTGMRDWQFWYNERFRKQDGVVTFYHPENPNDGGHNLHIPASRVLGDGIAAYLLTGDETAGLAVQQLCKGFSASMLGMVYDENDATPHIMSRNVVAFNHQFTTHDGKPKAVDYTGWYSEYTRWNCDRFAYDNNPYWGTVWITNMRSKDDVPHIFRLIPNLRYLIDALDEGELFDACSETLTLLEAFAKDIVDSGYRIRSKDKNGEFFIPGFTDDTELNKQQGDLASFVHYLDLIPEGECNARRGAELIGYHAAINEDCGRGEPNAYDEASYTINRYNKRICRYFHLAHLANALVNRDFAAAEQLMDGLHERMEMEKNTPVEDMKYPEDDWWRSVALYLTQSQTFGYPLTSDDVRLIHAYYEKAIEKTKDWPYWDLWDESVPDGAEGGYRPPNCEGADEATECWWRVEDLAQVFENCWSPLKNPDSAEWVDCSIVRDPSQWDESALD